jgi:RecB family exonuclease
MERLKYTLTHKGLSPSGLNIYNNCSLQFYYKYVLGVKAADDLGENIESDLLGSAVHYALEQLYAPFIGKSITVDVVKAMKNKDKIEAYVKQHIEEGFDTKLLAGKNYLLYRVSVKLVLLFLDNEIAYLNEGHSLLVHALESDLNGTLEVRGEHVKFKGIADRIDEVDGVYRIADYKTGKKSALTINEVNSIQLSDPKNAKQFQLLMYAWMFAKDKPEVKGLISGIYWLRNRSVDYYNPLMVVKESVLDKQLIHDFELCLTEMVDNMLDENIPFTMTEEDVRCKFCDYKNSCKR